MPYIVNSAAYSWTLEQIMNARDDQITGRFRRPVQLAVSMRTDDALHVAYKNRLAPLRALAIGIDAGKGQRAAAIAAEAEPLFGAEGVAITRDTVADLVGDLANHGVAVGYNRWLPREDGSRIDVEHIIWPLEYVWWQQRSAHEQQLVTQAYGDKTIVPITHGDGTWVVYRTHSLAPWRQDAAVLPAALVWARHAFAARDWSRGSASHGNAKVIGSLPAGVPLQDKDADGNERVSEDAEAFLAALGDVASLDTPYVLKPYGSELKIETNSSRAWEVWRELMGNAEKAAARIYLGTDGTLGAAGGAPGVDIATLFGVATTIVQGDIAAIESGVLTGIMEPWAAINFGDSAACPSRRYRLSDPDEAREKEDVAKRRLAMYADVAALRAGGFRVEQEDVDRIAALYDVEAPALPEETGDKAPSIALAPTDVAKVVRVNEARASAGLPPLTLDDGSADPDGRLTVEQFSAKMSATGGGAAPVAPLRAVNRN